MDDLKKIIREKGLKVLWVAKQLGLSREGLYKKLSGEREFKASEIYKLGVILSLSAQEVQDIFFKNKSD